VQDANARFAEIMTPNALADLRARLPGCELAVYVDFASETVLGSDGDLRYPQEHLDALCRCAATLFAHDDETGAPASGHAVFLSETGARVFLRAPDAGSEALCCICAPDTDFAAALPGVRQMLAGASG
jgi:hypothetical protein